MDSTGYYNRNSNEFHARTINVDMHDAYHKFLKHLPKSAKILDAGCGGGRDSKYFLSQGHDVVSFDGSIEMVNIATNLLEKNVHHMLFSDINFVNEFTGIWANASLLHVSYEDLRSILQRMHASLVPSSILYASFKYGSYMRHVEGRYFFDMNEEKILTYLQGLFEPIEMWKTPDIRSTVAASPDKSWLHIVAKNINI